MIHSGHFIGLEAKPFQGKSNYKSCFCILHFLFKLNYFRFILDNCQYVKNKSVLDVGSGSAACSIASVIAGASEVTANDIDPGADCFFFCNYLFIFIKF